MSEPMKKGQHTELQYSQEARHRVTCGLRWDGKNEGPKLSERLKGVTGHNVKNFDLDLICIMYDEAGEFVDGVSGKPDETADDSGNVYHTGDNTTGAGDEDDEQVSVELKDLPDYIHRIFFVAEIQSAHTFGDINNPEMRVADGMTNQDILLANLGAGAGAEASACVFAEFYRKDVDGGVQWMFHYIDDYMNVSDIEDWTVKLSEYIS